MFVNGITIWHSDTRSKHLDAESLIKPKKGKEMMEIERVENAVNIPPASTLKETSSMPALAAKKKNKAFSSRVHGVKNAAFPQPNNSTKKVSVATINTLALISFLMAPLFIVSLFTSSLLFILSTLIIGVTLATLCGFLADGRKGCWAVGIAIGFWIVIAFYLLLIFVVFG